MNNLSKILKTSLLSFVGFLIFGAGTVHADLGENGNFQTAGPYQSVPTGYALTAIGYGSDDHKCLMGIKTAKVINGAVDFVNADTIWTSEGCSDGVPDSSRNDFEKSFEPSVGFVVTGWTWGASTGGGNGNDDTFPPDECFYQEYMDLSTGQIS